MIAYAFGDFADEWDKLTVTDYAYFSYARSFDQGFSQQSVRSYQCLRLVLQALSNVTVPKRTTCIPSSRKKIVIMIHLLKDSLENCNVPQHSLSNDRSSSTRLLPNERSLVDLLFLAIGVWDVLPAFFRCRMTYHGTVSVLYKAEKKYVDERRHLVMERRHRRRERVESYARGYTVGR